MRAPDNPTLLSPSGLRSRHRRHPCLPAALAQLRPGSEHRDGGGVPEHHAEPADAARRGDHPQEGGPADEEQVGASALLPSLAIPARPRCLRVSVLIYTQTGLGQFNFQC